MKTKAQTLSTVAMSEVVAYNTTDSKPMKIDSHIYDSRCNHPTTPYQALLLPTPDDTGRDGFYAYLESNMLVPGATETPVELL